jgi:Bacterial PH domain
VIPLEPRPGEKKILQEDCAEDKLRNGILTLTNQRIIFERTQARMVTLSKKTEEVLLDIPLDKICSVKTEGFIIKKVVITLGDKMYKFGVFNSGKWTKAIKEQISMKKSS